MIPKVDGSNVSISFSSAWEAEQFAVAVERMQWVKFSITSFEVLRLGDEPKVTDDEALIIGSIVPIYKDKPESLNAAPSNSAIYVQHISGYSGDYPEKYRMMKEAGFFLLRSPRDEQGKAWEIWYLPHSYLGTGPVKGKTPDEIAKWVACTVGAGIVSVDKTRWCLAIE